MSSHEFAEWWALYQREPFGERRGDLRAALIASLIAETNRDRKKRTDPYGVDDFDVLPQLKPVELIDLERMPETPTTDSERLLRIRERLAGGP